MCAPNTRAITGFLARVIPGCLARRTRDLLVFVSRHSSVISFRVTSVISCHVTLEFSFRLAFKLFRYTRFPFAISVSEFPFASFRSLTFPLVIPFASLVTVLPFASLVLMHERNVAIPALINSCISFSIKCHLLSQFPYLVMKSVQAYS